MTSKKLVVVARSFQAGAGIDGKKIDINSEGKFYKGVYTPISKLLSEGMTVVVVTNTESGHKLCEGTDGRGTYPTGIVLSSMLSEYVQNGSLVLTGCNDWGPNAGSALALNVGARKAIEMGADWILNWSPEMEMSTSLIEKALIHADNHGLDVVGFLRSDWFKKYQYRVPQNTASIWSAAFMEKHNFFARKTTGEEGRTVNTEDFGEVSLAGMEDFELLIRSLSEGYPLRWGMVGKRKPLKWDTSLYEGVRLENHLKKVARQALVMTEYAKDSFSTEDEYAALEKFFGCEFIA